MKRRLFQVVVFLLLGATVNVAVAWGCAVWGELPFSSFGSLEDLPNDLTPWTERRPGGFPERPAIGRDWRSVGLRWRTMSAVTQPRERIQRWAATLEQWKTGDGSPEQEEIYLTESERQFRQAEEAIDQADINEARTWQPGKPGVCYLTVIDAGWPFYALEGSRWRRDDDRWGGKRITTIRLLDGAINIDMNPVQPQWTLRSAPIQVTGLSQKRLLPLRPIWAGFAVNTIFYAAILWLIIPGPFALRRHLRRKRGLCVACGYDLRHAEHDACPECGAAIPSPLRERARMRVR
ncbi:MAG: hypothetical protein O7F17_01560 [Planctomycetota bacterium]|nr:hypothetical protein [Planctomycetota bacterium]